MIFGTMIKIELGTHTLFDDESTREKHTVMDKYDVMVDDSRNPVGEEEEYKKLDNFLEWGKKYKFTLKVEEITDGL